MIELEKSTVVKEISDQSSEQPWSRGKYADRYSKLDVFPPKEQHDIELVNIIESLAEKNPISAEDLSVAEVGAGPAPISRLLVERGYKCKAFDVNPDMAVNVDFIPYDKDFDLTDPEILDEEKGKYDVVTLENVLYATALSPEGTRKYTKNEAKLMMLTSLKKAASLLKLGGFLVLSDPLPNTGNFGLKRILDFLKFDKKARKYVHGENTNIGNIALQYLKDPEMMNVLQDNKKIMEKAVLLDENEYKDLISKTGLFEESPEYYKTGTYLGSNITLALRRNNLKLDNEDRTILGSPIILEGKVHKNILEWIGRFRRKVYAESNTTDNLPEVDKYDFKNGVVVVYPSKNKLDLAAVATLQPMNNMGLDTEELMKPESGDFYTYLTEKISTMSPLVKTAISNGREINYAEIRRLAARNLGREDVKNFLSGLTNIFKNYSNRENIDIVLFMSDDKRFRMFNFANDEVEFKKVEGFHLNREDKKLQTMMISASNYFFKDWKNYLDDREIVAIEELKKLLVNGDNWDEVIKDSPRKDLIESAVQKILNSSPDNVSIYYTDYCMQN